MVETALILVVDDDESVRKALSAVLAKEGHRCLTACDGRSALRLFSEARPDLVILDVMMPEVDGLEVCRRIRSLDEGVPVLFLSALGEMPNEKAGFLVGADDYLVKPVCAERLRLRVSALLRRSRASIDPARSDRGCLSIGELDVDFDRGEVRLRGCKVDLTPKESRILLVLARHPGETFSKEDLIREIWGEEYLGERISVSVYVRRIREKIEDDPSEPRYLHTVWRCGYRLGD